MRAWGAILILLSGLPLAASSDTGSDPGSAEAGIAQQLDGIRTELHAITQLLTTVERHQQVMALMARIRLKQQALATIDADLRTAQVEHEDLEQQLEKLTQVEESLAAAERDGARPELGAEMQKQQRELLRQRRESLEARRKTLGLRIGELENDASRARDDIAGLEETVDTQLGLR